MQEILKPMDIEKRSFEIISSELGETDLNEKELLVLKRVIHTTADFDYKKNLVFKNNPVEKGIEALKNGCVIVTDTNMALAGINKPSLKKGGNSAVCYIGDEDVALAAKEKGVILGTGHVERFNPAVQKAKELIENDVIGDVVSASAKRVGPFPPRIKDVGVCIDLAIHDLDVMYYLFNEDVEQVYGTMSSILDKTDFEDHAEIMVSFTNATGILEVNWLTPYKRREIEITGTDGIISVDYIEQSIEVFGKFAQDINIKHEEPLKEELKSFLEAVDEGKDPVITGEDGLNALKMVIAASKSSRAHKPISFDELD